MNKFSMINEEQDEHVTEIIDINKQCIASITNISAKVKTTISSYLNVNIDDLLDKTDAAIFGGAVRDSIADLEIHDVDILALPMSANLISKRLEELGFKLLHLTTVDLALLYKGIKVIHEPWTFIKDNTIVQIIRPARTSTLDRYKHDHYLQFQDLLCNVDISACGVVYCLNWLEFKNNIYSHNNLIQVCDDAISHCELKVFKVYSKNSMYQRDRISHRIEKLVSRGWTQIQTPLPLAERELHGLSF